MRPNVHGEALGRLYTLPEVAALVGHTLYTIRTRLWRHRELFPIHRYKRNGKRPNQVRVLTEQEVERLMGLMVRTKVYAPDVSRPPSKSLKRTPRSAKVDASDDEGHDPAEDPADDVR